MFEAKIRFTKLEEIQTFVNSVSRLAYEVDIVQGRYTIDAKSIMGIFSLDTGKPLRLMAHTEDEREIKAILSDIISE